MSFERDKRGRIILPFEAWTSIIDWVDNVVHAWEQQWEGSDHRYGYDFAAFLGERFATDFDTRYKTDRLRPKMRPPGCRCLIPPNREETPCEST